MKVTREEKASLITTIRLLHNDITTSTNNSDLKEDRSEVQSEVQWTKIEGQQKPSRLDRHKDFRSPNRFEALNVEDNELDHDEDVIIIQINEQQRNGNSTISTSSDTSHPKRTKQKFRSVTSRENVRLTTSTGNTTEGPQKGSTTTYLNPVKIRRGLKTRVTVRTFPGANIEDLYYYLKPALKSKPEHLILPVGTNDLKDKSPKTICKSIADLGDQITKHYANTKLTISEIIARSDQPEMDNKVGQTNTLLAKVCSDNAWDLIKHHNIKKKHLNQYGVHLNKIGLLY